MNLQEVTKNYDAASAWYDLAVELLFHRLLGLRRHRKATIESLGDLQGCQVLDVGCGTGSNFPYLVESLSPGGHLTGFDYSTGMLKKARARVLRNDWESFVTLKQGDAANLNDIVPSSFDAVISVWCLGIVYDLEGALREILRVVKPGGKVAIMDFSCVEPDSWLRWLAPVYKFILLKTGIDTAEDLDDERLRAKWIRGRSILRENLKNYREETYLFGGIMIYGELP